MERRLILIFVLQFPLMLYASNREEKSSHSPRIGDELVKYALEFKLPQNGIFDLRDYHIDTKKCDAKYIVGNDTIANSYCLVDNSSLSYSHEKNDSLFFDGFENCQTKVSYKIPILHLVSPLTTNKKITGLFYGKGMYADVVPFNCNGNYCTQTFCLFQVILPNGSSFSDALLMYRKECAEYSFLKSSADEPQSITNETWEVYIHGYRYPIAIFTRYVEKEGMTQTAAFYFPLEEQPYLVGDFDNKGLRDRAAAAREVGQNEKKGNEIENFAFNLEMQKSMDKLNVNYSSSRSCEITFVLSNASGMVYQKEKCTCCVGDNGILTFDISGLGRGQYVVYANVAGKMFSEKFNVK